MQPTFTIHANQQDITHLIKTRLLSLQIEDKAGIQSDMLTLTLDDRDHEITLPNHGAELECSIGYENQPLNYMGLYVVDEVELSSPPATMIIRAHAADMKASLKSSRNHNYENITLGELAKTIASRHGLTAKIPTLLANISYDHINQIKESDLNLITRLSIAQDAIASIKAGNLIIKPKDEAKTISGEALPAIKLTEKQITSWRVTIADRQAYNSVSAHYYDAELAKEVKVTIGTGQPEYQIKKGYKNQAEAKATAKAKHQEFKRGTRKLSLTLPYQSGLFAERPIIIDQLPLGRDEGADTIWIIEEAHHKLTNQGLTTTINATQKS